MYIAHFSLHGLIRGESPEMGRDADTGGQITYVLDLVRALGRQPGIQRVDLFTRLLRDRAVAEDYGQPLEPLGPKARLVRVQCGGAQYRRKELLWPHLDEYIDKTLKFLKAEGLVPDLVHGHYADGGYVAQEIAAFFGCPFVFTGHSLGRVKKAKLLAEGLAAEEIDRRYRIEHRIAVEESLVRHADLIVTSTHQEIREQWAAYRNGPTGRFAVVPPGLDLERFLPYYHPEVPGDRASDERIQARLGVEHELDRFLMHPQKPLILALCRPDARKNIAGLVHAYGSDKELQAIANLAIFAGLRKDISSKEDNEREVLTEMLLLMDRYDLYGRMAIPKKHDFAQEVPALYRLAASRFGVFVNPAFTEPFGLTLLESSACGLPIVATADGGPADIVANCDNGILVDVSSEGALAAALRRILVDADVWRRYSRNGILKVREHYSWERHCRTYLEAVQELRRATPVATSAASPAEVPVARRLQRLQRLIVAEVDHALAGDVRELGQVLERERERERVGFVVVTGRPIEAVVPLLAALPLPRPDVLLTSVGTQIFYGGPDFPDRGWTTHIGVHWKRERLREALAELPFLLPQSDENQRPFKLSYFMEPRADLLHRVHAHLLQRKLRYSLVQSYGDCLDVLPQRASKAKALRYLCYKWDIPTERVLVAGGSSSDAGLLVGEPLGVVVANHARELEVLQGRRRVYFSAAAGAAGLLDGLRHYGLLDEEPSGPKPRKNPGRLVSLPLVAVERAARS